MIIKDINVYNSETKEFQKGSVEYENGIITAVDYKGEQDNSLEFLTPGFVDVHSHGRGGVDFMTGGIKDIEKAFMLYLSHGVTTLYPCVMTAEYDDIKAAIARIKLAKTPLNIAGIHIEGPYISPKRPGCHTVPLLRRLDCDEISELIGLISPLKAHITVAPELEGGEEFIKTCISLGATVGIGHSDAYYNQCVKALEWGCVSYTHTYNAMRPLNHREPGTVGAALSGDAYTEFICDGFHIHPAAIRLAYRAKGEDKFVIVSDSIAAADMPDGRYSLSDMPVNVHGTAITNDEGVIAGSGSNIFTELKNLCSFADIPFEKGLAAATINPCKQVGTDDVCGSITVGKRADFVVLDNTKENIKAVICGGKTYDYSV